MKTAKLDFFFFFSCSSRDCNKAASPSPGCCQVAVWKHPCGKWGYFGVQPCSPSLASYEPRALLVSSLRLRVCLHGGYPALGGAWLCMAAQAVVLPKEPGFGCLAPEGKGLSPAALPGLAGCWQSWGQWALPTILGCQPNSVPCCGARLPTSLSQSNSSIIKHEI